MMKKIFKLSFVVALLASIVSCDMDLRPINTIDPENAFTTIDDAQKLRTGMYIAFRGYTGGGIMSSLELHTDLFHATTSFGNRGGEEYEWTYTTGYGTAEGVWAGCYSNLKNVNYFLQEAAKVGIRNIRRDANDKVKADKKASVMTEDEAKASDKAVQDLTDKYIKEIDTVTASKTKEIMEI